MINLLNKVSFDFIFYFLIVTIGYSIGLYISYFFSFNKKSDNIKFNNDKKCYIIKPKKINCYKN